MPETPEHFWDRARGDLRTLRAENVLWSKENWVLRSLGRPSGLPVVVLLETNDGVLDQGGGVGERLADRLDTETLEAGEELPAGEWRSLSAELLQSLYSWR